MHYFLNDYSQGCHAQVLSALAETNMDSSVGYGLDPYCAAAAEQIRTRFACPKAEIHFLVGGTQANFTAISAFLRPWEAVIAAESAHIQVHETGAIEARGHKILTIPTQDGKLTPASIRQIVREYHVGLDEHMVTPRMVYLSQSTEMGTVYTKAELTAIHDICRELELLLYIDGARLAQALTSAACDLSCEDLPALCDAFYIGGTKNGLLFGEAMVLLNPTLFPYFRSMIKQNGGMLAKGRLLGVQFRAILEDDLWLHIARHANVQAKRLSDGLEAAGYPLLVHSPTNQVFVILPIRDAKKLAKEFAFEFSAHVDETHEVYRFVTSWATSASDVDALLAALKMHDES